MPQPSTWSNVNGQHSNATPGIANTSLREIVSGFTASKFHVQTRFRQKKWGRSSHYFKFFQYCKDLCCDHVILWDGCLRAVCTKQFFNLWIKVLFIVARRFSWILGHVQAKRETFDANQCNIMWERKICFCDTKILYSDLLRANILFISWRNTCILYNYTWSACLFVFPRFSWWERVWRAIVFWVQAAGLPPGHGRQIMPHPKVTRFTAKPRQKEGVGGIIPIQKFDDVAIYHDKFDFCFQSMLI